MITESRQYYSLRPGSDVASGCSRHRFDSLVKHLQQLTCSRRHVYKFRFPPKIGRAAIVAGSSPVELPTASNLSTYTPKREKYKNHHKLVERIDRIIVSERRVRLLLYLNSILLRNNNLNIRELAFIKK